MAKQLSKVTKALLETADDMHSAGLMDDGLHEKITVRHLGPNRSLSGRLPSHHGVAIPRQ